MDLKTVPVEAGSRFTVSFMGDYVRLGVLMPALEISSIDNLTGFTGEDKALLEEYDRLTSECFEKWDTDFQTIWGL